MKIIIKFAILTLLCNVNLHAQRLTHDQVIDSIISFSEIKNEEIITFLKSSKIKLKRVKDYTEYYATNDLGKFKLVFLRTKNCIINFCFDESIFFNNLKQKGISIMGNDTITNYYTQFMNQTQKFILNSDVQITINETPGIIYKYFSKKINKNEIDIYSTWYIKETKYSVIDSIIDSNLFKRTVIDSLNNIETYSYKLTPGKGSVGIEAKIGIYFLQDKNNRIMKVGNYDFDEDYPNKKNGIWIYYDYENKIKSEVEYKNDIPINLKKESIEI